MIAVTNSYLQWKKNKAEIQAEMAKDTMKAVIFKAPHKVAIEDRPIPKIKDPTDIIVKVINSALCGRQV